MADIKNVILKKKIGDILYELMVKTTAERVVYDDTYSLAEKLNLMLEDIADAKQKLATLIGDSGAGSITEQISTAVQAAVDAINNEEDPTSVAGKVKAANEAIAAINDAESGILATAKAYTDSKIGIDYDTYPTVKAYVEAVKATLEGVISGAFHFKGTVEYIADLPEGAAEGDVYQVSYAGVKVEGQDPVVLNAEFAWNGTEWVELGSIVDLSAYSTTVQVNEAIAAAKQEALNAVTALEDGQVATNTAAIAENAAAIALRARFIVAEVAPEDLTEADLFAQIITDAAQE